MVSRITDSQQYAHLWGTAELRMVFEEPARLQGWLHVLAALAEAQSELGIIPREAAEAIAKHALVERLDLEFVASETRDTGHSTLGLIHALQRILPVEAQEWVYYGTTVQDITDTWTALAIRQVGAIVWRDLREIETLLLDLAERYRDTLMAGRTHAQPGAPITLGYKVAVWADEISRHLDRLNEGAPRWLVGQLGGGVGTLSFYGDRGLELRRLFCAKLGLCEPGISWLTSRDRITEFLLLLAMVTSTLAKIGTETYELQRPEIGELREPAAPGSVGSITMPHKRNPEISEHLITLSRLVRAQAGVVLEGMVQEHERDGRGWKVEWVAFPDACLLTGTSLAFALRLLGGLEVNGEAMRRNLEASGGFYASEQVLATLSPVLGKHRAQALLQDVLKEAQQRGFSLREALEPYQADLPDLSYLLEPNAGCAPEMVDEVIHRAKVAKESEIEWGLPSPPGPRGTGEGEIPGEET
jgi:adenylosuccinate lyase